MKNELNELLADIGSNFFRAGLELKESDGILTELKEKSNEIAELNKKRNSLQKLIDDNKNYSQTEEEILGELNNLKGSRKSLYQKIGLEIYGKVKLDELSDMELKKTFNRALDGEKESENLEREIYKIENRTVKGNIISSMMNPLKLNRLKSSLVNNNKKNMEIITELGEKFCLTKDSNSLRESINDLCKEYEVMEKSFSGKKSSLESVKKKIDDTSKKILSHGSKSKIENAVRNCESQQKELFVKLGLAVTKVKELPNDLELKVNSYINLKVSGELKQYNEELTSKKSQIEKLKNKIEKKKEELKMLEEEKLNLDKEISTLNDSITSSQKVLEGLTLEQ